MKVIERKERNGYGITSINIELPVRAVELVASKVDIVKNEHMLQGNKLSDKFNANLMDLINFIDKITGDIRSDDSICADLFGTDNAPDIDETDKH